MPRAPLVHLQVINRSNFIRNMNNNDVRYPLIHMRDHLFHTAFVRLALIYARVFSARERKVIEFLLLSLSFLSLVLLIYIHMAFVQSPSDCLEHIQDKWPRDGILRVEILQEKLNGKYSLEKSYLKERKIRELAYEDIASYFFLSSGIYDDNDAYRAIMTTFDTIEKPNATETLNKTELVNNTAPVNITIEEDSSPTVDDKPPLPTLAWSDDEYIMEFSLEYGFLKLNPSVRKQYNITVELITLDPNVDRCFGGPLNNFILYNFLGYDEVLLASLKLLASKEEYKGYVRNVVTEVEFIFVNAWMDRKSYITAGFVMMVFTVSISILLRYSHHQIFVFIVELLHMLEFHSSFNFPAGPLLTVILALVGMEAIMSEFFNDTAIAFYVILIVWMADQFDTICCKSFFTKKHWLRFFYLYHFFFYAYSYRFGHNRFLALLTSWLFTVHSMVYFFHRYELPILVARQQRAMALNLAENNNSDNSPDPDDGTNQESPATLSPVDNSSANQSLQETDFSVTSISDAAPSNQNSENSVHDDSQNRQHNHADHNPAIEPRSWSDSCTFAEQLCEQNGCIDKFYSQCDKLAENQKFSSTSRRYSKSFQIVVLKSKTHFIANILTYFILYMTLILLFRNILLIINLSTYVKSLCSSYVEFWKFIPILSYLTV